MTRSPLFLAAPLLLLASSVDAFSVGRSSVVFVRQNTRMYAESSSDDTAKDKTEELKLTDESSSDILNSPAFLKRKLEVLNSDLAALEGEMGATSTILQENKAEWGPQLDALQNEYVNIQSRMTRQSEEGKDVATLEVSRKMLEVMDNYDRAFGAVRPETDEEKEIEASYKKTYDMILETFKDLGITEVETLGKEFDYEVHQAVMQRPSDEYDEGIVCDELAKGYILGDRLIRAAMVSVAA
mmetsp:Transcript_19386/g.35222  ORF Transcript_19386/g.35222 Transcript_19386/m.35222 type:complete len:241 (-) Transcript_19386:305-1027(-)|eukprot:CAMPEP_0198282988 /NCGR_PEP_ID=MMETSP1449-20131203/2677_1 /TAXON_ID=420275 /ORGANISM="Attheya septentrionalis, Strain CCMP2084" /LENGTH=240 /DNA_ID=CAMNT_0043979433 /DNA_START=88 /DNA_END=810 /DNA_ORIENTATION=-